MSPTKLICAVIATKTREIDIKYKEYWLNIIDKVKKTNLDIEFFFLYCNEGLKKMKIDGMDIYFPGKETKNDIIRKTIHFFKYIKDKPYDYLLRTNLSSFFNFPLLVKMIEKNTKRHFVFASRQKFGAGADVYPSGCGMVLSRDVVKEMADFYRTNSIHGKDYHIMYRNKSRGKLFKLDDVIIGEILRRKKIKISHTSYFNLNRLSYEMRHIKDFIGGKIKPTEDRIVEFRPWFEKQLQEKEHHHYRVSNNPDFKFIFERLIEKYYGYIYK